MAEKQKIIGYSLEKLFDIQYVTLNEMQKQQEKYFYLPLIFYRANQFAFIDFKFTSA